MTKRKIQVSAILFTSLLAVGACSQPLSNREKGALLGGGAGAAGGALIGGLTGAPGTGALIGGTAGAVGGAVAGDQKDQREREDYY